MTSDVTKRNYFDMIDVINNLVSDMGVHYNNTKESSLKCHFMQRKPVEKIERLQLDRTLAKLRTTINFENPRKGWIKTIRENLGMTTRQLAKRAGLSSVRITEIEQSEIRGSLTLETLSKIAEALNCRLIYTLIPEKPLQEIIEEQAWKKASQDCKNVYHSMALEDQAPDSERMRDFIKVRAEELIQKKLGKIWEGE